MTMPQTPQEVIQQAIKEILDAMGVEYTDVKEVSSELVNHQKFIIETDETGILIGKDGKHLSALSLLVRRRVQRQYTDSEAPKFYIDIGGYQSAKITTVQKLVRTMAERARSFKRDVDLPPMSAYERMWVHSTLTNERDLTTESEGEGKFRHVVIKYAPSE